MAWLNNPLTPSQPISKNGDGTLVNPSGSDEKMQDVGAHGDELHKNINEDYDVAEDEDRWMVE